MISIERPSRFLSPRAALCGALFLVFAVAPVQADELADGAQKFVRALADEAIGSLAGREVTQAERARSFRRLLVTHFDVPQIGKWALGRYWRVATPAEQQEYIALFEDFIVNTYAGRFRDYANEQLDVTDVVKTPDGDGGLIVRSVIVRDQPKPIRVDWRVATSGGYKIVDVAVEGVSMVQTQRSEFSSVIMRTGGKVSGLITELKLKNQSLSAQAD